MIRFLRHGAKHFAPRRSSQEAELLAGRVDDLQADLARALAGLAADIATLRKLVHNLYRDLGVKPPAGYAVPSQAVNGNVAAAR